MPPELNPQGLGYGEGWTRLVEAIRQQLPVQEIDGIWLFRTIRHNARDFGTAILSRVDGDRRRIYTARYVHTVKGKTRGRFEATIEEVGSGPLEALAELLALVPKRAEDEEPPSPIPVEQWFPPAPPEAQAESAEAAESTGSSETADSVENAPNTENAENQEEVDAIADSR